ncbi:hypothetical protein QQ39_03645 [Pragia fontium]|nr:hypothetical protein QQ39_03645 [Pragia fontium]
MGVRPRLLRGAPAGKPATTPTEPSPSVLVNEPIHILEFCYQSETPMILNLSAFFMEKYDKVTT